MANKFLLLLWKNYVLQKRHKIQTVAEILVPIAFAALLVLIRSIISTEIYEDPTYYDGFSPDTIPVNMSTGLNQAKDIAYAPNNTQIKRLMETVKLSFQFCGDEACPPNTTYRNYEMIGHSTEASLLDDYTNDRNPDILAGVIFEAEDWGTGDELPRNLKYKLRFPTKQRANTDGDAEWNTDYLYPFFQVLGPREIDDMYGGLPHYVQEGFIYLQYAIDAAILHEANPTAASPYTIELKRFPYPPFVDDIFLVALQGWLPMILVLSYIYPCINIAKSMVHEKEKRLKESMKIMGLPNYLHLCAWFLKSFIFLLISTILVVILLKIKFFDGGKTAVLTYADGTLVFVFFVCYIISVIALSYLISTLFSTANSAATGAGVLFFLIYCPYFFLEPRYYDMGKGAKLMVSLLSNTGLAFGCQIIAVFEGTAAGVRWSTFGSGASPDDNLTLLDVTIMLIVDSVLYFLVGVYIETVRPGDFGVPRPWYFPFTKSYWFGESQTSTKSPVNAAIPSHQEDVFEAEPRNAKAGIQIKGLTKVFNNKMAVNAMNLNMYENQVTALLGHNGAGKTTTMSMLTGLFPPTSGTALVNGYDIRTEIGQVRGSLGICPQHDVLFDELTCEEHIRFFGLMKGMDESQIQAEATRLLKALNLEPKRHAQAQTLSGGMKRKLSVAISLCGGSKVVLLDEPTSGMDPGARRSTWDLIQSEKKNRTIILSTHFMEEADLLGDRIAMMANGKVQCCGSSLFLKKQYGGGYHLVIVKEPGCDINRIHHVIQRSIPEAELDQNVGAELSYILPEHRSELFPDMFEELEQKKQELGIGSYGASITTMEEVFMKVGRIAEANEHGLKLDEPRTRIDIDTIQQNASHYKLYEQEVKNDGSALLVQQLRAMIVKKMLYTVRNRVLLIFQTLIPIFFLLIALIMLQTLPTASDPEPREMDLSKYTTSGTPITTYSCVQVNPIEQRVCEEYERLAGLQGTVRNTEPTSYEQYLLDRSNEGIAGFNYRYIVGLEMNHTALNDPDFPEALPTAYFNNQPFHGMPLALNFLTNAYRNVYLDEAGKENGTLLMANQPLPQTTRDKAEDAGGFASEGFQVAFQIVFGMSFLAASFVVFLIKEREIKAKHLQFVSGVKFPMFWAANFMFDFINYILPCLVMMILIVGFQVEDLKSAEIQFYLFILFVLYGFATLPMMYLFSFVFSIPSTGYVRMVIFNLILGMATVLAQTILTIPSLDLQNVADILDWFFMLLPQYNIGMGIIRLSNNNVLNEICPQLLSAYELFGQTCENEVGFLFENACCTNYPVGYFAWKKHGIMRNAVFLLLVGTLCTIWLFLIEAKIIDKIRFRNNQQTSTPIIPANSPLNNNGANLESEILEDNDVAAESSRIRTTNLTQLYKTENLVLRDLSKSYGSFLAVDKLCLGVQRGECFGLLGVNGAGKTTTFKMLTGDHPISSGDAFIYAKSVKSDIKEVQKNLGYCPQFDAIIEELTGRETLTLFARLRGVQESRINQLVDKLAANLLFTEHIDKRCGQYSGGNKRKLSTAIALVGSPPLVFLDEPTTGMDPVARRHLWNTITQVRDAGTSIILTSHSMEECEALCTRLSIMVNGKFRCLGSSQHLKTKFGEGYTLIAQISTKENVVGQITRQTSESGRRRSSAHGNSQPWEKQLQPLRDFIQSSFPGAHLKDVHPGYVQYHIATNVNVTWGQMFRKMEVAKAKFGLEAYSVGQTSLEQVFLNFTKAQVNYED